MRPNALPATRGPDVEKMNFDRANCLRHPPSFRTADVHLFDIVNPRSGQGIGAHFSAYSFCSSKKSKATAGDATPGFGFRALRLIKRSSLFDLLPRFLNLKKTERDSAFQLLQWCRLRPAAALLSLHVQKKVIKETLRLSMV